MTDFEIEIFGQNIPVSQQKRIPPHDNRTPNFRRTRRRIQKKIIELKMQGYKTERAFAKLLHLSENPYEAILNFKKI